MLSGEQQGKYTQERKIHSKDFRKGLKDLCLSNTAKTQKTPKPKTTNTWELFDLFSRNTHPWWFPNWGYVIRIAFIKRKKYRWQDSTPRESPEACIGLDRMVASYRCPHPALWSLRPCCLTWQKRPVDMVRLRTLKWELILDYLGGSDAAPGSFRGRQEGQSEKMWQGWQR